MGGFRRLVLFRRGTRGKRDNLIEIGVAGSKSTMVSSSNEFSFFLIVPF